MGAVLTGEGLQVSDKRVEAIVHAPRPKNQLEVRSALVSGQFCAKFIPGFSTISILRQPPVPFPEDSSSIHSSLRPVRTRRPTPWTKDYLALNSQEGMFFKFLTFSLSNVSTNIQNLRKVAGARVTLIDSTFFFCNAMQQLYLYFEIYRKIPLILLTGFRFLWTLTGEWLVEYNLSTLR